MMNFLVLFIFTISARAYVPTVESLFRHGSNPDLSANGIAVTMVVKKLQPGEKIPAPEKSMSLLKDEKVEDFYRLFFTRSGDTLKVAQTRYANGSFNEASLLHKIFYPSLNAATFRPSLEFAEKGLFFALLHSLTTNNGSHMVNYLKALGVPVKLNSEIINRNKVEFLADYKRYLVAVARDRSARKSLVNPMFPDDPAARERAQVIMDEPMYVDTKQVRLSKDEGEVAWIVEASPFEAVFSHKERDFQRLKYKTEAGELDIICKDYWLANGTHAYPRFIIVRTFSGQQYQIEVTGLRHYLEKDEDLAKRLRNWDQILKGKESQEPRPEFML